jgi:thiol:disulfide interchange protein
MARFGRAGVPFYTWYQPGSTEAELLPEIITKGMIRDLANLSVKD